MESDHSLFLADGMYSSIACISCRIPVCPVFRARPLSERGKQTCCRCGRSPSSVSNSGRSAVVPPGSNAPRHLGPASHFGQSYLMHLVRSRRHVIQLTEHFHQLTGPFHAQFDAPAPPPHSSRSPAPPDVRCQREDERENLPIGCKMSLEGWRRFTFLVKMVAECNCPDFSISELYPLWALPCSYLDWLLYVLNTFIELIRN